MIHPVLSLPSYHNVMLAVFYSFQTSCSLLQLLRTSSLCVSFLNYPRFYRQYYLLLITRYIFLFNHKFFFKVMHFKFLVNFWFHELYGMSDRTDQLLVCQNKAVGQSANQSVSQLMPHVLFLQLRSRWLNAEKKAMQFLSRLRNNRTV